MKKTLFFLFALFVTTMSFAYEAEIDGIAYNFDHESKTATVMPLSNSWMEGGYTQTEITIPEKVTYNEVEYSVTSIGEFAFCFCDALTSITIPNSVTSIVGYAFYGCSSLIVTIPNSVTSIGAAAFQSVAGVKLSIDDFEWYMNIQDDVAPAPKMLYKNGVEVIDLVIPNTITTIPDGAFSGCSSLTTVTIPNSVTSIGGSAFSSCSSLTTVTMSNSVTSIGESAFSGCSLLTEVIIPNSVTSIASNAFRDCSLTAVTIPSSVTTIGDYAFYCESLTSVHISDIASWCNVEIYDPWGKAVDLYLNGDKIIDLEIPEGVDFIKDHVFAKCKSIESVTIPNSVTSIGSNAFGGCSLLAEVIIPNSVTSIASNAFRNCSSFTSIKCYASVDDPFGIKYRTDLTELVCPASWLSGFTEATQASYTNKLTEIVLTEGEVTESIFNFISRSRKTLHTIDLSGTMNTTIVDLAFADCYKLEKFVMPAAVEIIGFKAFEGCLNLKSIEIPATVTEIGDAAFYNCHSMGELSFEDGAALNKIGSWAFYNNHALGFIDLPEGVTEIGDAAFYGCNYVEEIVIPASVQRIGDNGFALCKQLQRMEVRATIPPIIEAKTFYQVDRNIEFVVPAEARNAYAQDEYWREFIGEIPTEVEDEIDELAIYILNGEIHIDGLTADYQVYNMSGVMVYSGRESVLSLPRGIYMVVVEGDVEKVVI